MAIDLDYQLQRDAQTTQRQLLKPTPPLKLELIQLKSEIDQSKRSSFLQLSSSKTLGQDRNPPVFQRVQPASLYTPLFALTEVELSLEPKNKIFARDTSLNSAPIDNLDQLEQGSGYWNGQILDDPSEVSNEVAPHIRDPNDNSIPEIHPTRLLTPRFQESSAFSSTADNYINKPPLLNRRLPKLFVVAGKFWKHFIPYDTFVDEDGDLRQLRSTIIVKKQRSSQNSSVLQTINQPVIVGDYFSWIQYDQTSKLLYGFPTDDDIGVHQLVLLVKDKFGALSEEMIEIYVKQHPSHRAHSHLLSLHDVSLDLQSFPSMVDALGEFFRRIATKLYNVRDFDDLVIKYYKIENMKNNNQTDSNMDMTTPDQSVTATFSIAWYNSSVPVHSCNITTIEALLAPLVEVRTSNSMWLVGHEQLRALQPSKDLIKISGSEFKPYHVSLELSGVCESRSQSDRLDLSHLENVTNFKIKNRIGSLNFFLGQLIDYKIPAETFEWNNGPVTKKDLHLSLLTIDGHLLEQDAGYNFMEFDSESQTLYGLPYDYPNHAGQKELLLIAIDPITGRKLREAFVLNVEPFDLTSINNRAFKISLYLIARTVEFGPKERVMLGYRMMHAIKSGSSKEVNHTLDNYREFIVTEVQKFSSSVDFNLASSRLGEIVKVEDDSMNSEHQESYDTSTMLSRQEYSVYKFSWTNSTIGQLGNCPYEVIQKNILYALEESMMELDVHDEDSTRNDSVRFFNRLHHFFEPENDLVHLRFEPTGSCLNEMDVNHVGRADLADQIDKAINIHNDEVIELWPTSEGVLTTARPQVDANDDEYWSIVVLIILVVALIFVIVMFFMGIHTYKMNQDQRLELQLRLAQARSNSMYLSSVMLANQAAGFAPIPANKQAYDVLNAGDGSRKPVILDNERVQLGLRHPTIGKHTTVQLDGYTTHTLPIRPTATITLESLASGVPQVVGTIGHSSSVISHLDDNRTKTLQRINRSQNQPISSMHQTSMYNINQTMAPTIMAAPLQMVPIFNLPTNNMMKRRPSHIYRSEIPPSSPFEVRNSDPKPLLQDDISVGCSSSTAQSIISNPNFVQDGGKLHLGL